MTCRALSRRKLFPKLERLKLPRFSSGMPVPVVARASAIQSTGDVEVELTGMPVSVGQVSGTARVVKNLSDAHVIQQGDVLIVPYTDVGWAPYFPLISGIVTELGGLVSHGAVVAREYGLPSIASCYNATDVFQSGDQVYLDGTAGFIRRMKAPN